MATTWIDVTDLVEFLQRRESVSGVQRVIAEATPLLMDSHDVRPVVLDRGRGEFIALTNQESSTLLTEGARSSRSANRDLLATTANATLARAATAAPVSIEKGDVLVFLGALWISDALMVATRDAHARGAKIVDLLYDLTPVLQTGHTAAVNKLFERYLTLIAQTASRVPAISENSLRDFHDWCNTTAYVAPQGSATGLPAGLTPASQKPSDESPWPRPYALIVGTIEARKNHILAFRAWEKLIEKHGSENVPDLVCVGRLGWHASEFLREFTFSKGLNGKVSILTSSTSDEDLANFYAHAQFTVYPSNYEGWGLPVSESLEFGVIPVVADNSSLREAGRDLAVYFTTNDVDALVSAIEDNVFAADKKTELVKNITSDSTPTLDWNTVAAILAAEIDAAHAAEGREPMYPQIELGREYMLAVGQPAPDEGYADQYLEFLVKEGLTPLLKQPRGERDFEITDAAVIGTFGSPQTWGNELRPGRRADFRVTRPVDGDLTLLISTRSMPGVVTIEAAGPGGPVRQEIYLGSVVRLPLGEGKAGEPAQVSLTVVDASDSVEGFLGIRSFVVLRSEDKEAELLALESANAALRQEIDFIQNTRSWKVTAPLRKWKGRGAN